MKPFKLIIQVLFSPKDTFEEINLKPSFLAPFIFTCTIVMICLFLSIPFYQHFAEVMSNQFNKSPLEQERLINMARNMTYINILLAPIVVMIIWAATAFVLWSSEILLNIEASYKKTFVLVSYAYTVNVLKQVVSSIILFFKGAQSISSPDDFTVHFGFNLFLDFKNPLINYLLDEINIFNLWYIFLLILGISVVFKIPKIKSSWIVLSFCILATLVKVTCNLYFKKGF
ncbi:MAG: YIP1 family protein [bacterium]|nr:YIP1 family protein [bacterium]